MRSILKHTITLLIFCFLAINLYSQISFTATSSSSIIKTGDRFQIQFTTNAPVNNFKAPDLNAFRVLSGPNQSTQMSWINDQNTQLIMYSYILMALKEGDYTIGAATATLDEKKYKTEPFTISVGQGLQVEQYKDTNKNNLNKEDNDSIKKDLLSDEVNMSSSDNIKNIAYKNDKSFKDFFFPLFFILLIIIVFILLVYEKHKHSKIIDKEVIPPPTINETDEDSPEEVTTSSNGKGTPEVELERIKYIPSKNKEDGYYPVVFMPKENNIIKFPKNGKLGRIGKSELTFFKQLESLVSTFLDSHKNKILTCKNSIIYEPDIIISQSDYNLYIDIEIDEPYEGLNNSSERKPLHYIDIDKKRNVSFTDRGWIVLRFSEKQIIKEPIQCINYILKIVSDLFIVTPNFDHDFPTPDKQWTYYEAIKMSKENYREKYLKIEGFNPIKESEKKPIDIDENDEMVESFIYDTPVYYTRADIQVDASIPSKQFGNIKNAIENNNTLKIETDNKDIIKPIRLDNKDLLAYSYIYNIDRYYHMDDIISVEVLNKHFLQRFELDNNDFDSMKTFIEEIISSNNFLRMEYTSYSDQGGRYSLFENDNNDIELLENDGKTTIRTIKDYTLSKEYNSCIEAFCFNRNSMRTFKFSEDRIKWIEVLNLEFNREGNTDNDDIDYLPF